MPRFFIAGTNLKGGMAIMKGRDAEHAHVLRLRPGDDVILCDTEGSDYKCRIVRTSKEEVEAEVLSVTPCLSEPTVKASVLCGLPKGNDKTDYIIQKSVEAGAFEVRFFSSAGIESPKKLPSSPAAGSSRKFVGWGILPSVLILLSKRIFPSFCMKPVSVKALTMLFPAANPFRLLPLSPGLKAGLLLLKRISPV